MPISIAKRGCLYLGRHLTWEQLWLGEKISFCKTYTHILNYKLSKLMSLNLKCSFLADYSIYHNKNYKVTVELTWDKILLIILSPKLAWEKIFCSPPDTLVHVCCCFKRTRALKWKKTKNTLQLTNISQNVCIFMDYES